MAIFHFKAGAEKYIADKTNITSDTEVTKDKVFVIHAPISDLHEFNELAKQASRLKPFGRVEVNVSNLADKGFHEIPEGRNYWYEYASYNPTLFKFFPDSKIAPFIPESFVKKNRELLFEKSKILQKYGLECAFWSYEPNFLSENFFDKYPEMMGPRVDHPRRGNYPAFAPCICNNEFQEIYSNMVFELLKNVPDIHTFFFKTNDAGSGVCWSDWQYTGPNGPAHCKNYSMGERIAMLMNSFKNGAEKADKKIQIYLTASMFSDAEKADIYRNLPEDCYFQSNNSDEVMGINSMIVGNYPVRGMFNPVEIIKNINSVKNESVNTVFISFRSSYDRNYENIETIVKFFDLLTENLSSDNNKGPLLVEQQLLTLCEKWGGKENQILLYDAFNLLEEAKDYKNAVISSASSTYWGVSARMITRPLVINPALLTQDEEDYFLKHVFNPSEEEARMDYTDIHGSHHTLEAGAVGVYVSKINRVATMLEQVTETAAEKEFIRNIAKSLKIHAGIFRSIGNFAEAQSIRDRNSEKLLKEPHRPDKTPTWDGDPDFQEFMSVMRDELDNSLELINILENGGMNFIAHAKDSKYEDTFLLGPDLINQLKNKIRIMLKHWTDIEGYLASPFK